MLWVLYVLLGLLLVMVGWGLWRIRGHEAENGSVAVHDSLLVWLSLLAAVALGVFVIYTLVGLGS